MKKQSAFTLVELMITMAIIAILATSGILAYADYTKKSRDTARAQIAQNLNSSVMAYAASNEGNPPADRTEFEAFLDSAGESFGGGGNFAGGNLSLVDPVGGKDVCLDADGNADEPCRFDYTAYADGTYAISYGVEHKSSTEGNFYKTTKSVLASDDEYRDSVNTQNTITKYGVSVGSARYIGSPSTKASNIAVQADSPGIDELSSVSLRSDRIDRPSVVSPNSGRILGHTCRVGRKCSAGLNCVLGRCEVPTNCGPIGGYATVIAEDGTCWFAADLGGFYQWKRLIPGYLAGWTAEQTNSDGTNNTDYGDPCTQKDPSAHTPSLDEWNRLNDVYQGSLGLGKTKGCFTNTGSQGTQACGSLSYYWSSTTASSTAAHKASVYSDGRSNPINTQYPYPFSGGMGVRCIVR